MTPKHLRTRTEKILFPIAIIFSALVWLLLIFAPLGSLLLPEKTADLQTSASEPCVFVYDDEYRVLTVKGAEKLFMKSKCLDRKEIPDDVYLNALQYTLEQQSAELEKITNDIKRFDTLADVSIIYVIVMYILMFLFFFYFMAGLSMAHIRLNGVRLGPKQYGKFYEIYEETAKTLGLKKIPRAYVIHAGGTINAFAIKISRKKMIVFFAEIIEELVEEGKFDELRAVAAHELTHVLLKHVNYWFFLAPFRALPYFEAWLSRARELSADRGAFYICKDHEVVSRALLKLVTGKTFAKEVDMEEYLRQLQFERGFFIVMSRLISSHPPIPVRIKEIRKLSHHS